MFAARLAHDFVVGAAGQDVVALPKSKGVMKTIVEDCADAKKRGELEVACESNSKCNLILVSKFYVTLIL